MKYGVLVIPKNFAVISRHSKVSLSIPPITMVVAQISAIGASGPLSITIIDSKALCQSFY